MVNRVPEDWRREEKLSWLTEKQNAAAVDWQTLRPDGNHTWLIPAHTDEFITFLPMGTRETKSKRGLDAQSIFKSFSLGVGTNRDQWVYDFSAKSLAQKVGRFVKNYNYEVFRLSQESPEPVSMDDFVNNDPTFLKWTDRLKETLKVRQTLKYDEHRIRQALYRPFTEMYLYFDGLLNHRQYQQHYYFPASTTKRENQAIIVGGYGRKEFSLFLADTPSDLNFYADPAQCFPFCVYDEDGSNRRENITDWGLQQFRDHYGDTTISKWDVFYYVYGLLHHPGYREKFADNLKRELPRIPFAPDFQAFASAGKQLARLHLEYEDLEPYALRWIESDTVPLSYRADRMKLSKDKTSLVVNDSLTLAGIPPEVFAYRLGNRSALEWVIDQYRVKTDKRSGIRSDPNRLDDEKYIVRLVGQVVRVSLETVSLVRGLPEDSGS